jgi:nicotinamidase-related amidase
MNPALLVLDPQNDFFAEDNPNLSAFQVTVPLINNACAIFRTHKWPVAFIQHTSQNKPSGSIAWQIHDGFESKPDDLRLSKAHYNAFWNTKLDSILKSLQIELVVICGYVAEYCVLSTLRGALERSYRAVLLKDAIASLDDRYTHFVMEISPTITLQELT